MLFEVVVPLGLLLVGAVIIGIALTAGRRSRKALARRVSIVAGGVAGKPEEAGSGLSGRARIDEFDAAARQFFAYGAGHTWGMEATSRALATASLVSGGSAWPIAHYFAGLSSWISLGIAMLVAFLVPRFLLLREQQAAEQKFMDCFPDVVDSIARMLRAGLPIISIVRTIGAEASPPVDKVFAMLADQTRIGIPIQEALDVSSERIGLADFRFFTVAVVLQHATGGNLASTLEILSEIIRKRRAVRLKAKAASAEIRISAYVLGGLPFVTSGALLAIQPTYLVPLFQDPRGRLILGLALAGLALSILSMRQMMRSISSS